MDAAEAMIGYIEQRLANGTVRRGGAFGLAAGTRRQHEVIDCVGAEHILAVLLRHHVDLLLYIGISNDRHLVPIFLRRADFGKTMLAAVLGIPVVVKNALE